MHATVLFGGDVRIGTISDARVIKPTDALVVVSRAAICGSESPRKNSKKKGENNAAPHMMWS